jgi:hypothetical protein
MGTCEIKTGETWIVKLHDARVCVEVIAAHGEFPRTWICLRVEEGHAAGTGPHILLHERAFLQRAAPVEQARE